MSVGIVLLLVVTLVWGTTFPLVRAAAAHLNGLEISALRFLVAGLCMAPFAVRADRTAWRDGLLLGATALASYVLQAVGLQWISSNRSAFITALNVLMVPFLALLFGARLSMQTLTAATLACLGIGLMSWDGGAHWLGDGATLLSALIYAFYIILLARRSRLHSPRTLAATQIVAMALISNVLLLVSHWHTDAIAGLALRVAPVVPSIVYLGVVASAAMLFLQVAGQRLVTAQQAAVIFALEPVFAALFGWLWLQEAMSSRAMVGASVVVLSVIFGEWRFSSQQAAAEHS